MADASPDAVIDGASADGGTNPEEPLPPGCQRHAITFEDAGSVDAALATGWQSFKAGNGTITIEDGRLLVGSPGIASSGKDEVNVSFRRDGVITRVTCTTQIEVSSFATDTRFVELRLIGPRWGSDNYTAYGRWSEGEWAVAVQGGLVDSGTVIDTYGSRVRAPATGQKLPLFVELTAEPQKFTVKLGDSESSVTTTPPGEVDFARVIIGALTTEPDSGAYEIRYDDIECVTCVAQ